MIDSIFVTTGTQLPFDRLLKIIDQWASENKAVSVIAQTCSTTENYEHLTVKSMLAPSEYKQIVCSSNLIIGHAGVGTIITAHENEIPIIIMPRKFELGEHRNDHQLATAKKFADTQGVYVAEDEEQLANYLNNYNLKSCKNRNISNRDALVSALQELIG